VSATTFGLGFLGPAVVAGLVVVGFLAAVVAGFLAVVVAGYLAVVVAGFLVVVVVFGFG